MAGRSLRYHSHCDLRCEQVARKPDGGRERSCRDAPAGDADVHLELLRSGSWLSVHNDHWDQKLLWRESAVKELLGPTGTEYRQPSWYYHIEATRSACVGQSDAHRALPT